MVCLEGKCMYSCASSKESRKEQLQMLLDGETEGLTEICTSGSDTVRGPVMMMDLTQTQLRRDLDDMRKTHLRTLFLPTVSSVDMSHGGESEHLEDIVDLKAKEADETTSFTTSAREFQWSFG